MVAFGLPATPELMFLGLLSLLLFGPKKLPAIAKGFGKLMAELQKAKEEFRREILNIPSLPEIKEPQEKKIFLTKSENDKKV
jgi:Sec-independent protein translocase protein TatA